MQPEQVKINAKQKIMNLLNEWCPDMKLVQANRIAEDYSQLAYENFTIGSALIVVAELAGMDNHGNMKKEINPDDKAMAWAVKVMLHQHGMQACSPFGGGIEGLKNAIATENWK